MSITPLFDERAPLDRDRLAGTLRRLASERIWIGTSSWKYPGWIGQIYSRERYLSRGNFARKRFEAECLAEYASTFPAVCGDFTFYQFPSETQWRRLFQSAPETLRFAFKVTEQITVKMFPSHPRYGAQGGLVNMSFLDARLLQEAFLAPLTPHGERVAVLIFEFGTFPHAAYSHVREFVRDLDRFLALLPRRFRYAVEIRNPEYLGPDYFHLLRTHGIAHVFNAWSRMPDLGVQLRLPDAYTADYTVCRALLRHGRPYEEAVQLFSPYEEIRDPYPEGREAIRDLIRQSLNDGREAFVFVNNRLEGNAPLTIEAVVE
jgi:uncharacterized protein YecE (DUF72 family)